MTKTWKRRGDYFHLNMLTLSGYNYTSKLCVKRRREVWLLFMRKVNETTTFRRHCWLIDTFLCSFMNFRVPKDSTIINTNCSFSAAVMPELDCFTHSMCTFSLIIIVTKLLFLLSTGLNGVNCIILLFSDHHLN